LSRRSRSSVSAIETASGIDLDDRVERGAGLVERVDALQVGAHDRGGRVLTRAHALLELGDRHSGEAD
jgi:hypothetical protein